MSYRVVQRTNEFGVRMTLGARRREVLWLTLREDLGWIGAGLLLGIPLALAGSRFVRSLLYDVDPVDPATLVGAALVMALSGIIAGLEPAWRASRVEPAISLRHD
jgi:ABC-type antimicrobial peptide transport system permease subunit